MRDRKNLRRQWLRHVVALMILLAPAQVRAHEFSLLMLHGNARAEVIADMRTAVLIASHERDNHPDETSDGHLGGLDVHLSQAADGTGAQAAGPDIIAVPLGETPEQLAILRAGGAAVLGALSPTQPEAMAFLASASEPSLAPFAAQFHDRTGRDPGPQAVAAYLAARRIDLAVRALGGAENRAALSAMLAK